MLFFLRKIRRKAMSENKLSTYLLYAVGEIILVVVGILIAVQIDDWNEERKVEAENQVLLANLKKEFEFNKIVLSSPEERMEELASKLTSLLSLFGTPKEEVNRRLLDSLLVSSFSAPRAEINSAVFRSISSSGKLEVMNNQELKNLLFVWESTVELFKAEEGNMYRNLNEHITPTMERHISFVEIDNHNTTNSSVPPYRLDNRLILTNSVVENLFHNHLWEVNYVKSFYSYLDQVIDQILLELEK